MTRPELRSYLAAELLGIERGATGSIEMLNDEPQSLQRFYLGRAERVLTSLDRLAEAGRLKQRRLPEPTPF